MIKMFIFVLAFAVPSLYASNGFSSKLHRDTSSWGATLPSLHKLAGGADQPVRLMGALQKWLKGCDLDAVDEEGYTPLARANEAGHVGNILLLLELGVDHTQRRASFPCSELIKFFVLYDKAMINISPEENTRELRWAKIKDILIKFYEEAESLAKIEEQERVTRSHISSLPHVDSSFIREIRSRLKRNGYGERDFD